LWNIAKSRCFGCGASGDAIDFVCKTEHLSFPEAVERLASIAGMDVGSLSSSSRNYKPSRKKLAESKESAKSFLA
jgi:DNA primase